MNLRRIFKTSASIIVLTASVAFLGGCYARGGSDYHDAQEQYALQNYHTAFEKMSEAAQWKDANAQYALGYMYYYGIGTEANPAAAAYWIGLAAKQGQPQAIAILPELNKQYPHQYFLPNHEAAVSHHQSHTTHHHTSKHVAAHKVTHHHSHHKVVRKRLVLPTPKK